MPTPSVPADRRPPLRGLPDAASADERAGFARGQAILNELLHEIADLPPQPPQPSPPIPQPAAPSAAPPAFAPGPSVSPAAGADRGNPVLPRVEAMLARIAAHEPALSGFTRVMGDAALDTARRLDRLATARRGPLHGMVVSIKDIIDVQGVVTSGCSHSRLSGPAAGRDAPLVARLRAAGAVIIGKANCHEFAFGGPAFDLPFPPARNPWDVSLFPGGSSSGSGVTVAAGFCDASIGTDTAGSVRLPASHCGVVGLKLAHGTVPMAGVHPLSPALDSIGPLAGSVADCVRLAQVLTGAGLTMGGLPDGTEGGARLLVPEEAWLAELGCEDAAHAATMQAQDAATGCGLAPVPVALPALHAIHAAASVLMLHEVARGFGRAVRADFARFGEVFRNRALLGEAVTPADCRRARAQCAGLARALDAAIGNDVLMLPGSAQGPTPLVTVDKFYFLARPNLNIIANCAGLPVLSLPVLRDAARRPFGVQLLARRGNEARLVDLGRRLEAVLGWSGAPLPG